MTKAPLTRGFAQAGVDQIYFESAGTGPALVLCHGASGNHATWFKQVSHFAGDRQVITWDHRGFGLSTMNADVSRPRVAVEDLHRVLDALAVDRIDIVGQSMGGWTAVGFALAHPQRVRSLILTGTTGGVRTPILEAAWNDLMARVRKVGPLNEVLGVNVSLGDSFIARSPMEAIAYQAIGGFNRAALAKVFAYMGEELHDREAVSRLRTAVLVVAGAEDKLFAPEIIWEAARQFEGAEEHLVTAAGHSAFFEAAEAWNTHVEAFLNRLG
jgi:pimeloyl-ACP methyl ester carboxylesterase